MAASAGDTTGKLEDHLVSPCVTGGNHAPHVARGRPQLVPASGAKTTERMWLSVLQSNFFSFSRRYNG